MKGKQTVKNQRAVLQAKTLKNTSNDGVKFSPQRAFVQRRNLEVKIPNLPWSSPRTRCQKPRLQGRKRQQLFLTFSGRKSRCHAVSRLTVRVQAALKLQWQLVGVVAADPRFVRALEKEGIYSEATAFLFCYQLCFRSSHLWMENEETAKGSTYLQPGRTGRPWTPWWRWPQLAFQSPGWAQSCAGCLQRNVLVLFF